MRFRRVSEGISEQIAALRGEATQSRCLAAMMTDQQAITDLVLYAEALEAEAEHLLEALGAPQPDEVPVPAHAAFLTRFVEHA